MKSWIGRGGRSERLDKERLRSKGLDRESLKETSRIQRALVKGWTGRD